MPSVTGFVVSSPCWGLVGSGILPCDFRTGPSGRSRSSRLGPVFLSGPSLGPSCAEGSSGRHRGKDIASGQALGVSFLSRPNSPTANPHFPAA